MQNQSDSSFSNFHPHPDVERLTLEELRAELATTEESFGRAKELRDEELHTWFIQRQRLLPAELGRRDGQSGTRNRMPVKIRLRT